MPLVISLVDQSLTLVVEQLRDGFYLVAITCDERGSAEELGVLGQAVVLGEETSIGGGLRFRFALSRSKEDSQYVVVVLSWSGV